MVLEKIHFVEDKKGKKTWELEAKSIQQNREEDLMVLEDVKVTVYTEEGRSFVTNGPMLFLDTRRRGSRMRASVDVSAREPIDRVELVANGEVIHRFPSPKASKRYRGEVTVDPAKYSWIAARCFLQTASTIRLAHSAPVYLDGKWDAKADAEYFLQWIDDLIAQATSDAKRFASPDEREQVLALYRKAQAFYASKAR